jgi:hypothetical protein
MTTVNTTPPESNRVFEEFSPKKLVLQVQSAGKYLLSRWWKILGFGLLLGIAGAAYSFTKKPNYVAEITFAMDEGVALSSKSELSGIAEQLGLASPLEAGGVFSSITNIGELMRSRLMIEKTLKTSVDIDGKQLVFADFFLDSLGYRDKWMKNSPYSKINFAAPAKDKKEALFVNTILKNCYEVLTSKCLKIEQKGKGSTIIAAQLTSGHELFSKYFLEAWIAQVTEYYTETKTQRSKLTLDFIRNKADSTRTAYNTALYGKASFTDANINPIRETATVPGEKRQTDVQILKTNYIQLMNALENARTSLMRDTPLFQALDTPVLPLKKLSPNKKLYFIAFFLVGCLVATIYLTIRRGVRYILQS